MAECELVKVFIATVTACLVLGSSLVQAHPLDLAHLRVTADGSELSIVLDLSADGVGHMLDDHHHALRAEEVAALSSDIAAAIHRSGRLTTEKGACRFGTASAELHASTITVRDRATCPAGSRQLHWTFPFVHGAEVSPRLMLLVKADVFGHEQVVTIDAQSPELHLTAPPTAASNGFAIARGNTWLLSLAVVGAIALVAVTAFGGARRRIADTSR